MRAALLIVSSLLTSALPAQEQPLVGSWQIAFTAGMRIENGTRTPVMGTGVLTIEAQGDSLVGILKTDPTADAPPRPTIRMTAPTAAGKVAFRASGKATVNRNGEASEVTVVSTWILEADGAALRGTVERSIEGMEMANQPATEVTGSRVKP